MDPEAEAGNFADDDTKSENKSLRFEFVFQHDISLSWMNFRLGSHAQGSIHFPGHQFTPDNKMSLSTVHVESVEWSATSALGFKRGVPKMGHLY